MRRREFLGALGGAAAWPLLAHGQQAPLIVGYLGSESPDLFATRLKAFREGLSSTGFDEGRNVIIEYRWAQVTMIAYRRWQPTWFAPSTF